MPRITRSKLSHRIALLWAGILIPVLVALVPLVFGWLFPRNSLTFTPVDPVTVDGVHAFSVEIENEGRAPQNDVEVWIPFDSKATGLESLDSTRRFLLEASLPVDTKVSTDEKFKVIHVASLRPHESVTMAVSMGGHGINVYDHTLRDLRVVSRESAGILAGPNEETIFLYKLGSILLLALLALLGIYGVYYTYFMDPKKKEEMILQEIDKL